MAKIKADILKNILEDGEKAKSIPGMNNRYTPDEYDKVITRDRALSGLNGDSGGYLVPEHEIGAVEFDSRGRLSHLNRSAPAMLDLNVYCANRYIVEKGQSGFTGEDGKPVSENSIYIVVVFGYATVKAIEQRSELPNNITAHRFRKKGKGWEYIKAEMIRPDLAYTMSKTLRPIDALRLMQIMNASEVSSKVEGDNLDDIS